MSTEKTTLGRGLGSLLGVDPDPDPGWEKVQLIPLDRIRPNPRQPRQDMDPEALSNLADSIREQGVLLPILVRPAEEGDGFELVAGERRWRASMEADLKEIPALVREWDDGQSLEITILENVQREDLNPVETARGYESLIQLYGYSHKKVGRRVGKNRTTITNMLRLLKLPKPVLDWVVTGELFIGHARALLALEDNPERLMKLAEEVVVQGFSVRETETLVRNVVRKVAQNQETPVNTTRGRRRDPVIQDMETRLASALKTKVSITHTRGKGKVIVEYADLKDLDKLVGHLLERG